jgi:hypothetical protein
VIELVEITIKQHGNDMKNPVVELVETTFSSVELTWGTSRYE